MEQLVTNLRRRATSADVAVLTAERADVVVADAHLPFTLESSRHDVLLVSEASKRGHLERDLNLVDNPVVLVDRNLFGRLDLGVRLDDHLDLVV